MSTSIPTPLTKPQRMSYRIGRGETGVLTFEPYKSLLLPLWRFKTVPIARRSSSALYAKFTEYGAANDFIGMDMARKFLQMGMTRAKRYANHKGGRKYDKQTGEELKRSEGHDGKGEKEEASLVFKAVWEKAKTEEGYLRLKEAFLKEQKEWDREEKLKAKSEGREYVKVDATRSARMQEVDREKRAAKMVKKESDEEMEEGGENVKIKKEGKIKEEVED